MLGPLSSIYFYNETASLGLVWLQPTWWGCILKHTSAIDAHICQTAEFPGKRQMTLAIDPTLDMTLVPNYETVASARHFNLTSKKDSSRFANKWQPELEPTA